MKTVFFKQFLMAGFRVNAAATVITLIKELGTDYSMERNNPVKLPHDDDYKTAEDTFIDMGANLKEHPLQLTPLTNQCTNVHANLLTGEYCLGVFHHSFDEFKKNSHSTLSRKEFERAMYAHESVHAMERHDLLNTYISSTFALTAACICIELGVQLRTMSAIAFLSALTTSRYVSRRFELRADRVAAEKYPKIRNDLISIFSVPDHKKDYFLRFFDKHPTRAERREALEAIRSSASTH